jgi:hypothetical protein
MKNIQAAAKYRPAIHELTILFSTKRESNLTLANAATFARFGTSETWRRQFGQLFVTDDYTLLGVLLILFM